MESAYTKAFPEVMKGKKILYVHGFGSSGQSGTVERLRGLLPGATVTAPDLPVHPAEAMALLRDICSTENPDLVVGTSMGGMFAEMLYGRDRILVNPAFRMADDILKNNMLGKVTFLNPRRDGMKEFMMTKQLMEEYREATEQCFAGPAADDRERVWGLFGLEDPVVHTCDLFAAHYPNAVRFHGEHRMNDGILLHSVIPVIRWIDDRRSGRQRPIVYIGIDAMRDSRGNQQSSAMKALGFLLEYYDVYIVAPSPSYGHDYVAGVTDWVNDVVNVPAWNHLIFTNRKDLLYGDYLIDPSTDCGAADFSGTLVRFGDDTFKTWEEIIEYFGRLGGQ